MKKHIILAESRRIEKMHDLGRTAEQISRRMGIQPASITHYLKTLEVYRGKKDKAAKKAKKAQPDEPDEAGAASTGE